MTARLDKLGIKAERLEATRPPDRGKFHSIGDRGIAMMHRKLLDEMIDKRWKSILIIEDDAVFRDDFHEIWKETLEEIAALKTWGFLFMGGLDLAPHKTVKVSKHLELIQKQVQTHLIGINLSCAAEALRSTERREGLSIDLAYNHAIATKYKVRPILAYQELGWSNIKDKRAELLDVTLDADNFVENCSDPYFQSSLRETIKRKSV
jgi:GR25 family glycosyltransferase involved in LPS biosynthesis